MPGSGELVGPKRPGLALLHAEILLTGADVGVNLCRGGSVTPQSLDLGYRPSEGNARGDLAR
jgi:hypothetical protein